MARLFNESAEAGHSLRFTTFSGGIGAASNVAIPDGGITLDGNRMIKIDASQASVDIGSTAEFYGAFFFASLNIAGAANIFAWKNGATTLGGIKLNAATHVLELYTDNFITLVASGTHALTNNTAYHIQVHVKINDATGVIEVKLDNNSEASFSGDTKPGADTLVTSYQWLASTQSYFDNMILNDINGSIDNTWPDVVRFRALTPTGPGFYVNNWSRNTGSTNWEAVDEIPNDGDTTYVFTTTANIYESFSMSDQSLVNANYMALITSVLAKKDSGTVKIALGIRDDDNNTNYWGANSNLGTSYGVIEERRTVDPSTGVSWTSTGINSTQALIDSTT